MLSRNQEGGATSELENVGLNRLCREEAVKDADRQNPSVEVKVKLLVDLVQPVQKLLSMGHADGDRLRVDPIFSFIKILESVIV